MPRATIGGVTIDGGEVSGLTLDGTCDVSAAAGAGGTPADGSITLAKLNGEVTAAALGGAASSHDHNASYAALAHAHDSWVRVTGSNATTTGQALTNIAGLSIALLANSVYEFEAVLTVQSSSTAGNAYGVQYSAAGATVEALITGTLAAATQKTLRINALNTAATPFVTSGATGGILIKGVITTGANAGNLTIQHYKVTSGTSTVFINSSLWACKRA